MSAPRFRIRCWGTRGTCPSPGPLTARYGGNTSCIEVRSTSGALLVLDAGTGIRGLGAQIVKESDDTPVHLFLSHQHGDHVFGLPHFAPLLTREQPVCLYCGNADAESAQPYLQALLSPPMFPLVNGVYERLRVCDWAHGGVANVEPDIRVYRLRAQHPGEAAVLRIDDAHGPAIGYAPDNELAYADTSPGTCAWRASLIEALRGIPLLVHDATYRDDELAPHVGWGHSSGEEATRFALECGARILLLFHHHPDRSDGDVDIMLGQCREIVRIAGSTLTVAAAYEGQVLSL